MLDKVKIVRTAQVPLHPFKNHFQGFENVEAVKRIFGIDTNRVLDELKIEFTGGRRGYMGVHDQDGHMFVNVNWLKDAPERILYLDVVHELVHVKQHKEGRALFDESYDYVDRPTEIEAYKVAVAEARAIGLTEEEVFDYLRMDRFTDEEHFKLCRNVGVQIFK